MLTIDEDIHTRKKRKEMGDGENERSDQRIPSANPNTVRIPPLLPLPPGSRLFSLSSLLPD